MLEKPKRAKQLNNQDRQIPATIQELINRYDLENKDIYKFLDYLVDNINGNKSEVIDNLESESNKDALSANQGRILNEKFRRRIITACVDRKSFTVSESWGSINLAPFDSYVSNTDKLIVTNSGIVIGEGVSKVLVSAHSKGINHYAFPGDTVFGLRQNNNEIQNSYMTNLNSWCSQSIPATLLNCKEGDVFSIYLTSGGTGTGELLGESLTIEIIE